jgi:glycolate oxidase iron-sulfur subunit
LKSEPLIPPLTESGGAATLGSALARQAEALGHCVHCGFCLPACPTYTRLGDEADSPRGRLHLMRAVVEGRLDPSTGAFQDHIDRCLGCRACETVCPSGVGYGHLLERAREVAVASRPGGRSPVTTRLLLATMASRPLTVAFGLLGQGVRAARIPDLLLRILPRSGARNLDAAPPANSASPTPSAATLRLMLGMLKTPRPLSRSAFPPQRAPDGEPERSTLQPPASRPPASRPPTTRPFPPPTRGRVALLRGCVQGALFEHVHAATRLALRVNGWDVVERPGQGCCGALHAHAGDLAGARRLASANLRALDVTSGVSPGVPQRAYHGATAASAPVEWIAVNAAGCGALMKTLPELFEDSDLEGSDSEDVHLAERVSARVRDISELLAGEGRVPVSGAPLPLSVVYDPPCHLLHGQRVSGPPERILDAIPDLIRLPLQGAEACCGGAGIYGLNHPELGGSIGGDKARAIVASGAALVVTGNPGCQMQIGAELERVGHPLPVLHPVELLAESYRRAGWTD